MARGHVRQAAPELEHRGSRKKPARTVAIFERCALEVSNRLLDDANRQPLVTLGGVHACIPTSGGVGDDTGGSRRVRSINSNKANRGGIVQGALASTCLGES